MREEKQKRRKEGKERRKRKREREGGREGGREREGGEVRQAITTDSYVWQNSAASRMAAMKDERTLTLQKINQTES